MISPNHMLPDTEPLSGWLGRRVKVKGLLGAPPELLMVGELVGVSEVGAVLSWKGHLTFFPWSAVHSLSLDEEPS